MSSSWYLPLTMSAKGYFAPVGLDELQRLVEMDDVGRHAADDGEPLLVDAAGHDGRGDRRGLAEDQVLAALLDHLQPFGDGRRHAGGLDHVLRAPAVGELQDHLLALVGRLHLVDVDDVVRAPVLGQLEPVRGSPDHDDLAGAALAGDHGGVEADGAAALDDDVLHEAHFAEPVVAADHRPEGAADAHGLFLGELLGDLDHVGDRGDVLVFGEAAPERAGRSPAVPGPLRAQHRVAGDLAPVALAAVGVGPHDAVADLERLTGGVDDPALRPA